MDKIPQAAAEQTSQIPALKEYNPEERIKELEEQLNKAEKEKLELQDQLTEEQKYSSGLEEQHFALLQQIRAEQENKNARTNPFEKVATTNPPELSEPAKTPAQGEKPPVVELTEQELQDLIEGISTANDLKKLDEYFTKYKQKSFSGSHLPLNQIWQAVKAGDVAWIARLRKAFNEEVLDRHTSLSIKNSNSAEKVTTILLDPEGKKDVNQIKQKLDQMLNGEEITSVISAAILLQTASKLGVNLGDTPDGTLYNPNTMKTAELFAALAKKSMKQKPNKM